MLKKQASNFGTMLMESLTSGTAKSLTYLSSLTVMTPSSRGMNTAILTSSLKPSSLLKRSGFRTFPCLGPDFISAAILCLHHVVIMLSKYRNITMSSFRINVGVFFYYKNQLMTLHFVLFFFLNIPERSVLSVLRLPEILPIGINKVFFNGLYFIYHIYNTFKLQLS